MNKNKKKVQFSKIIAGVIIIILLIFSIWACIEYYVLTKLAIEQTTELVTPTLPDSALAIACITSILGVFASYCLYQFGLKDSLNRNGLEYNELTGTTRKIPSNSDTNTTIVEDTLTKKTKKVSKEKNKD